MGPVSAIPAVICGHIARGRIARSGGALGGSGLAIAGLVLGYLSIFMAIVIVVILLTAGAAALPFLKQGLGTGMTKVNAIQIAEGVRTYQTQYGRLPLVTEGAAEDVRVESKALLEVLLGRDTNENPQKTVLFQTLPSASAANPENDGWGQPFNVALDATGDGEVKLGELRVPATVAVWSSGPNKLDESGAGDDVPSWR